MSQKQEKYQDALVKINHKSYESLTTKFPDNTLIFISKEGSANYGHFITEIAPKLVHLASFQGKRPVIVLPENASRFTAILDLTCNALGIQPAFHFVERGTLFAVEDAHCISAISQHDFRKSNTLRDWRARLLAHIGIAARPERRIFIKRAPGEQRNFSNTGQIEKRLNEFGFEAIYPGDLSFIDQVQLFASASHIIGGLGAGLTNALFAGSEAKTMMITPGLPDRFFWDIACLQEQQFYWFFAKPLQHFSDTVSRSEYEVPMDMFMDAITTSGFLAV